MLNRAEFNQLQSQTLSHMARSMYVFYIQPQVRQGHSLIDPVDLSRKLISSSMAMPCNPTIYDIEIALNELEQHGLIHRLNQAQPWQNASIILPLFARELAFVPQPPFTMVASWQPGPGFKDAALLAGLADGHHHYAHSKCMGKSFHQTSAKDAISCRNGLHASTSS